MSASELPLPASPSRADEAWVARRTRREVLLAAPLLAISFVAAYDAVLCLELHHRLGRAAAVLAGALAASGDPALAEPAPAFAAASRLALPTDLARASVIVRLIAAGPEIAEGAVLWQRRLAPAGRLAGTAADDALPGPAVTPSPGSGRTVVAEIMASPDAWIVAPRLVRAWAGEPWRASAAARLAGQPAP